MITLEHIQQASAVLQPVIHNTPLVYSYAMSGLTGSNTYFKLENLQRTGSFKIRGAYNKIWKIRKNTRQVIAASAGNHALGVALASRLLKIKSTLVMPEGTPINKVLSVKRLGADVVIHGETFDDAYKYASVIENKSKMTLIHAFNDEAVISGQGTIGLEVVEALKDVDVILVPVGGGGLVSGIAVAAKSLNPDIDVIGVEARNVPSMSESLKKNRIVDTKYSKTIADGIAVKKVGDITFEISKKLVDDIIKVNEKEIEEALMIFASKKRLVVEGSGAVGLAGLLKRKKRYSGKNVVIIVSGGNIDINVLGKIIDRHLKKDGRIMNLEVELHDVPGALAELSAVLGELKANIIEISHDRIGMDLPLGIAYVKITIQTINFDHQHEIVDKLKEKNFEVRT